MINIQKSYSIHFGFIWSFPFHIGPILSTSVLFGPFNPLQSYLVYSVHIGLIRSILPNSVLFSQHWSYLIHFSPINSYLVHYVHFGPNLSIHSYSVHFNPIRSTLFPFCPIPSILFPFCPIPSTLFPFGPLLSIYVHLHIQKILVQVESTNSVHFFPLGPIRSI